jgi:hypothetical protein
MEMKIKETFKLKKIKLFSLVTFFPRKTAELIRELDWKVELRNLLKDVPKNDIPLYTAVLQNMHKYVEATTYASYASYNRHNRKILKRFPSLAKVVLDNIKMRNFVGVQPMSRPVGLAHCLRFKKNDDIYRIQRAPERRVSNIDVGKMPPQRTKTYLETIKNEDNNRISLNIISHPVEALSHKLDARMSIEAVIDTCDFHGIDVEREFTQALGTEIGYEIDRMLEKHLDDLAIEEDTLKIESNSILSSNELAKLTVTINKAAIGIAKRTRRGPGNNMLVSPQILNLLKILEKKSAFDIFVESEDKSGSVIRKVGRWNDSYDVYCDPTKTDNTILVGYKGPNETDAGMFWLPYHLLMSTGVVVDATTFQPLIRFFSRSGILAENENINASNYYAKIPVEISELKASEQEEVD